MLIKYLKNIPNKGVLQFNGETELHQMKHNTKENV
jgi:hypothetical protein